MGVLSHADARLGILTDNRERGRRLSGDGRARRRTEGRREKERKAPLRCLVASDLSEGQTQTLRWVLNSECYHPVSNLNDVLVG